MNVNKLKLEVEIINYLLGNNFTVFFAGQKNCSEWYIFFRNNSCQWNCCGFHKNSKDKGLAYAFLGPLDFVIKKSQCYPSFLYGTTLGSASHILESLHSEQWDELPEYRCFSEHKKIKFNYVQIEKPMGEKSLQNFLLNQSIVY